MDKFEQKQMKKKKPIKNTWYDWLINYIPESVRKSMGGFKVRLSPSKNISFYLLQWKPFKNDEKCSLFHLKSSLRSQDI